MFNIFRFALNPNEQEQIQFFASGAKYIRYGCARGGGKSVIRYDENSGETFVRHLTNAEKIVANALSMVEAVKNNFGSTEGYEFYINPEHEKILKKSAIYLNNFDIPKEPRLFGHKVNVSDNCPLDKIYFMIPIDVDGAVK